MTTNKEYMDFNIYTSWLLTTLPPTVGGRESWHHKVVASSWAERMATGQWCSGVTRVGVTRRGPPLPLVTLPQWCHTSDTDEWLGLSQRDVVQNVYYADSATLYRIRSGNRSQWRLTKASPHQWCSHGKSVVPPHLTPTEDHRISDVSIYRKMPIYRFDIDIANRIVSAAWASIFTPRPHCEQCRALY